MTQGKPEPNREARRLLTLLAAHCSLLTAHRARPFSFPVLSDTAGSFELSPQFPATLRTRHLRAASGCARGRNSRSRTDARGRTNWDQFRMESASVDIPGRKNWLAIKQATNSRRDDRKPGRARLQSCQSRTE